MKSERNAAIAVMDALLGIFSLGWAQQGPQPEGGTGAAGASPPQSRGRLVEGAGAGTGRPTTKSPVRFSAGGAPSGTRASTEAVQARRGSARSTSPVRCDKEKRLRRSSVSPARAAGTPGDRLVISLEDLDDRACSPTSAADRRKPDSAAKPLPRKLRPGYRDPQQDVELRNAWKNTQAGWW